MSATVPKRLLETVDNPVLGDVVEILPEERTGELGLRLDAARTIRRLAAEPGDYKAIAAAARDRHRAGDADARSAQHGGGRPAGVHSSCGAARPSARCCTPGSAASSAGS